MSEWHKSVCRSPATPPTRSFASFIRPVPPAANSPIDGFLSRIEDLVKVGSPTFFKSNASITTVMLVAAVSETENYFRELFARLLVLCPQSQARSSTRDIKLGSALWFSVGNMERGAFEHYSFASREAITETLQKYFEIKVDEKSDPWTLLQQFDLLCELRHAAVHSAGMLSGKNAMRLNLSRTKQRVALDVDFARFQDAVDLCTSLVCSMNTFLFKSFAERWRDHWPRSFATSWKPSVANHMFNELWRMFLCETDKSRGLLGATFVCVR